MEQGVTVPSAQPALAGSRKQDLIAALQRRQPPTAVPIWELEFHAWDAVVGKHVVLGHEFEALSSTEQERALFTNAEIMLSASAELNFAALTGPNAYWEQSPGQLAYYCLPGDARFRQLQILKQLAGPELLLVGITSAIISANYDENFCLQMFEDPASVDKLAESYLQYGLELARRFRDCGAEALVSPSDIADNSGPFFNREQMDRWILPNLDRWGEAVAELGMFSILHSDGQLTPYLDAIADTNIDALQAVDPVAGMDMSRARQIVGDRLCLCGNVDCGLLLRGQPAQVYEATKKMLTTCKGGGGLVLGASNAVQPEVPVDNYRAMIQAWRDHGRYDEQVSSHTAKA